MTVWGLWCIEYCVWLMDRKLKEASAESTKLYILSDRAQVSLSHVQVGFKHIQKRRVERGTLAISFLASFSHPCTLRL